ncbi:MAG: tetratricopeptide repeat protein [Chloroflexi bacterium]|nr:tetratricopeptide repeat protein [Chloroflexota bacterium]
MITNGEQIRDTIIPTATPEPTRSATQYALLADLSEQDGELEEAAGYYETAVRLDATKPEFYIRLINLLVQIGQPERALEMGEQATVLAPDNEDVWTAVAAAHIANGDRLYNLGDPTGANLEYAEAVRAADSAIAINSNNATAFAYKAAGLVFPQDPAKYDQAQEAASFAVDLDPDNAIARLYMANTLELQAYYEAAREHYQFGIDADPTLTDLYIGLAYNYFGTGSVSEAILTFQDAIAVDPKNAVAFDGLAYMYLQLGELPLAKDNAAQAIELDPNMARAYGRLGEAYFKEFNYDSAIEELETAVNLYGEPNNLNARFFYMLAAAYIRKDLNLCPQAVPIFEAVSQTDSFARDSALEGLDECRRAQLESTP